MPPPAISPQMQGSVNVRSNLYNNNTPPLQPQTANFAPPPLQQAPLQQTAPQSFGMNRPFTQENNINQMGTFGKYR